MASPIYIKRGLAAGLPVGADGEPHWTTDTHVLYVSQDGVNYQINGTPPAAHASSHQNGGADEISVAGLSGLLADAQTPTAHASSHQNGGSDEISVAGLSGLLADAQTPTAHASSHQNGGSDAVKLDDLAAPDDNTDLNASTTAHGLLPKGPNLGKFLRDDVSWQTVSATDEKTKVTSGDTTAGYLAGKLLPGSGISLAQGSPGGDETLTAALSVTGLSGTDLALDDWLIVYDVSLAQNRKLLANYLLGLAGPICQGRLTTESGSPVSTSNRTSQGTLYFTPYNGNKIKVFDTVRWKCYTFSEISLSLSISSGSIYDVFLYDNSGTLTLELSSAWSSSTSRTNALVLQDGIYVKSGATNRLWLGTIKASGSNIIEDSTSRRFVWNNYNRVRRHLYAQETTSTWTYTTASFREINGGSTDGTSRVSVVFGAQEDAIDFLHQGLFYADADNRVGVVGIGVDGTTNAALATSMGQSVAATRHVFVSAKLVGFVGLGGHSIAALEYGGGSGTITWRGTTAHPTQQGLAGTILG